MDRRTHSKIALITVKIARAAVQGDGAPAFLAALHTGDVRNVRNPQYFLSSHTLLFKED